MTSHERKIRTENVIMNAEALLARLLVEKDAEQPALLRRSVACALLTMNRSKTSKAQRSQIDAISRRLAAA